MVHGPGGAPLASFLVGQKPPAKEDCKGSHVLARGTSDKHALDFGARSALMLINHSLLPRCAMLRGAQARLELAYGLQAKIMLNDYGYAPSTCEPL